MKESERQIRGLYDKVNISVRTLNKVILVLCVLLILCLGFAVSHNGFDVSFDTLGGTAVESQTRMHGELVEEPETPKREGYVFDGWYRDARATVPWNISQDMVTESMTLYAGWKEK